MADRETIRAINEVGKELHELNKTLKQLVVFARLRYEKDQPTMPDPMGTPSEPPLPLPDVASPHPYFQRSVPNPGNPDARSGPETDGPATGE